MSDGELASATPAPELIRSQFVEAAYDVETPSGDLRSDEVLQRVDVTDGVLTATVNFTTLDSTTRNRIGEQLRGIGLSMDGVDHVRFESETTEEVARRVSPSGVDTVIAVAGSKGGVGKTTITLALARLLEDAGLDVGVFDADFQSPDVTALLELSDPLAASATGKPEPAVVDGVQVVSLDLIAGDRPGLWTGARTHDVLVDLFESAAWDDRDVLLVDLPPGLGDVAHTLFSRTELDGVLVVTTPADVSVQNLERTVSALEAYDVPIHAVVENLGDGVIIHEGQRDVDAVFVESEADPTSVTVPFDAALQQPATLDRQSLAPWTEEGLETLSSTVRDLLAAEDVPAEAINLTGLPPTLCETQALLEFTEAPDGPVALVVSSGENRPDLEVLEAELEAGVEVREVTGGRQLLTAGGEPA